MYRIVATHPRPSNTLATVTIVSIASYIFMFVSSNALHYLKAL